VKIEKKMAEGRTSMELLLNGVMEAQGKLGQLDVYTRQLTQMRDSMSEEDVLRAQKATHHAIVELRGYVDALSRGVMEQLAEHPIERPSSEPKESQLQSSSPSDRPQWADLRRRAIERSMEEKKK
jgi:hypothetical protein